ncbi:hypothetical protein [Bacillus sp. J14TS2]|uniref:hypothetical protein n=1 Tax=Bacillus sp. J14TS2 TaxID=2807188 RepID=UPI001BB35AE3|nr:hypothetical protein [Bacillus sp. J14TS2]
MKNEHHYTVKNTTVEHPNINNHPTSYYLTRIYEDHNTYESAKQQDHSPYNHNVVQKAFINVIFAKQVHEVAFAHKLKTTRNTVQRKKNVVVSSHNLDNPSRRKNKSIFSSN